MKYPMQIIFSALIFLFAYHVTAQNQLEVEGDVRVNGVLKIGTALDSTSIVIGLTEPTHFAAHSNTIVGFRAGNGTAGNSNCFFGRSSGASNGGFGNVFMGHAAGANNTSGFLNSFYGNGAGDSNEGGKENVIIGHGSGLNLVETDRSVIIGIQAGQSTQAQLEKTIAIGYNARVDCSNCATIGGKDDDAVFIGIGTNHPDEILHFNGPSGVDMKVLFSENESHAASLFYEGSAGGGTDNLVHLRSEISGSENNIMTWQLDGKVGIGDEDPEVELDVVGSINYTGSIMDVSDMRLKENIAPIDDPMSKISGLDGFTYNLVGDEDREVGISAQMVKEVLPEAVGVIDNGHLGVDYTQLIPLLIEGIKDQQSQIEKLSKEISDLRNLISRDK